MSEQPTLTIIQESEHFVILRPPRKYTKQSEALKDFEFILSAGYRPLALMVIGGDDAILCEKLQ